MSLASTLRDVAEAVSPPWLTNRVGLRFVYAMAVQCDAFWQLARTGVKAHMPGVTGYPATALPYVGSERQLDRYEGESDAVYAARLAYAHDRHRGKGGARELVNQVQTMCAGLSSTATPVRTVSNTGVWDSRPAMIAAPADASTGFTHLRSAPNNWVWDALTTRWWRGWLIIDSTNAPWVKDMWGDPGVWGDGGVWGCNATVAQVTALESVVRKWKSEHSTIQIIVTFASGLFEPADTSPPNPNGTSDTFAWQAAQAAIFGRSIT